ncbi:hypothetical protein AVEN_94538-1 [Araneus ventricosus]|uniref:RNase H type-1 domain-containing protein n=1 Tax=Araneus ventricosus TaxID=182803 RepID=A0A4Y2SIZ6_ARAVE|nr:hypothetical protein AVEN_94538-1 [Araneus ventricosus]
MKTKLTHLHQKITRIAGTNWGLNKDLRRRLFKTVAERMILHGAAAWAYPLSARQSRLINSIQRKFLLNITGAYSSIPTAALQIPQLSPFNTVFQAELLAIQEACLWASKTNQQIKVWSDRESSLHSIASIDTKSPIAQQTQEILLKSTNIKLGWINAHVGYSGNEAADVLVKKATQEGIPTFIPAARNHIKSLLQKESIIRWQKEWDNGETGRSVHNGLPKVKTTPTPWQRPEIMFVTGHVLFPTYLKRFNIRSSDSCGCGKLGNPLHYATSCMFTTSYHLTKPSADLEPLWWKRVMNNNNSRAKIKKLIHFIAENETLLFPKHGDNN